MSVTESEPSSDLDAAKQLARAYEQLQPSWQSDRRSTESDRRDPHRAVRARHCLVQGVTGLAKTLLVSTLARAMDFSFGGSSSRRPHASDITGRTCSRKIPRPAGGGSSFRKGRSSRT
jgi:hypothetical protein